MTWWQFILTAGGGGIVAIFLVWLYIILTFRRP